MSSIFLQRARHFHHVYSTPVSKRKKLLVKMQHSQRRDDMLYQHKHYTQINI